MSEQKALKCGCKADKHGNTAGAEFQDNKLGPGIRYHNRAGGKGGTDWRCTICGAKRAKGDA